MRRLALIVALITTASLDAAHACPPPPRDAMREHLELLTPAGTDIPEDGGLVIRRTRGYDGGPDAANDVFTVQTRDGTRLPVEVVALPDGLELWKLAPGARELQLVDHTGKVLRTFRQTRVRARRAPAAPRIKRLAATAALPMRGPGVPASTMRLDLSAAPPASTLFLLGDLVAVGDPIPWLSFAPAGTRYDRATYAHKGCSPGPAPVSSPSKLRFRYLSADGRLSSPSRAITTARMR
jgi:hypothetical protein